MPAFQRLRLYAVNFKLESLGFAVTETDVYEYVATEITTFAERIKAAIDADTTMQAAYAPSTVILRNENLARFEQAALLTETRPVFVLHGLRMGERVQFGSGRKDLALLGTLTGYVRFAKGVVSGAEAGIAGDGTAAQPSIHEIMGDAQSLLTDNFLLNAGERYVFAMSAGEVDSDDGFSNEMKGEIVKASMPIEGHKWIYTDS